MRSLGLVLLAAACQSLAACGGGGGGGPGPGTPDAGGGNQPDAPPGCVPTPDQQLCIDQTAECGNIATQNGCGQEVIINCGTCTAPEMCTFGGSCCADEGDLCARKGYLCGEHDITDYCFVQQHVDCGGCNPGLTCSEHAYCGVCLGGFARSTFVPASTIGMQDVFLGAAADGSAILFLTPEDPMACGTPFTLHLADGSLAMFDTVTDITLMGSLAQVTKDETSLFLAPDGLTIIAVANGTTLGETQRASAAVTAFGPFDTTPYDLINGDVAMIPGATVQAPVISGDGLSLYYLLAGAGAGVDGIYEARRAAGQFAPGVRLGAEVQAHLRVTGVSADALRLYLLTDPELGVTTILMRFAPDQPFTNPWAPEAAPTVPGFRVAPMSDCLLIGNWEVDGCRGEEIVLFEAPL